MAELLAGAQPGAASAAASRAVASVNLAAIERNCARLRAELAPGALLCAVVKADGYGHGAAMSARAALEGGAGMLAVADAREARELRDAGLRDVRLMVMGALAREELAQALAAGAEVLAWREEQVAAVQAAGGGSVHVKLDTGMGRLGTADVERATRTAEAAADAPGVELAGVMTHFATADQRDDEGFFEHQLALFARWAQEIKGRHPGVIAHAANSAALLREPRAHFDMARCGVAVYGMDPFGEDPSLRGLEPALELITRIAELKPLARGQSTGYGRRYRAPQDTVIGILPIGYGDGWRRALSGNAEAIVAGVRRPLVGTVSMDSVAVELGSERFERDAEAVLIGSRGAERITAEDLARRLETINYEITCAFTPRVTRRHHRDGEPVPDGVQAGGAECAPVEGER